MRFAPREGEVGDPIPFFWKGEYHLFYLKPRGPLGDRYPWSHAVSTDLIHWEELPDALTPGEHGAPDSGGCWTGSVIAAEGKFHIFYTGWNPGHPTPQTICHATSEDLVSWTKDRGNPLLGPDASLYATADWRDPFVFWNAEEQCYWMLITAKLAERKGRRAQGCLAVAQSADLSFWQVCPPLWLFNRPHPPECPDLFRKDGRWALVFSDLWTTHRTADNLLGPWRRSEEPELDDCGFYAAKTFHAGERNLLVGWVASHQGGGDGGGRLWGGALSLPRELRLDEQGAMCVSPAAEVMGKLAPLARPRLADLCPAMGEWQAKGTQATALADEGDCLAVLGEMPDDYAVELNLRLSKGARAGIVARLSEGGDKGYMVTLDHSRGRLAFSRWENWREGRPLYERPLHIAAGRAHHCCVFVEGTVLEAFVDGRTALSARIYDFAGGGLGLYATGGRATFSKLRVSTW